MKNSKSYVVCIGPVCWDEYYTAVSWPREGDKGIVDYTGRLAGGMMEKQNTSAVGISFL